MERLVFVKQRGPIQSNYCQELNIRQFRQPFSFSTRSEEKCVEQNIQFKLHHLAGGFREHSPV
jgi:hypothetical protein